MPKTEKVEAVAEIKKSFEESDAAVLAEFRGLKVEELKELRRALREAGAEFKVVKNTLTRLAVRDVALEDLLPMLEGSTAIAFIKGDPIPAAKGIDEISKKYPALVIKGGWVEGAVLDASRTIALAKVKPREVLLAELAGMLNSPLQKLVLLLSAPLRNLGYALAAYIDKLEKESPVAAGRVSAEDAAGTREAHPESAPGPEAESAQPPPEQAAPAGAEPSLAESEAAAAGDAAPAEDQAPTETEEQPPASE